MAGRHSLTVQVASGFPGHVAMVLNTPEGQTYAGFGPQVHHHAWSPGKFDVHTVGPGEELPSDYSNILGSDAQQSFTIPISEAQAKAARDEIDRIRQAGERYSPSNVCSTVANRIMRAAGLGNSLYRMPNDDAVFLGDAAHTLALNPNASVTTKTGVPIPDSLRGLQQDYAYVGGGYDTPSERIQRAVLAPPGNSGADQYPWQSGAPAIRFLPPAGTPVGAKDTGASQEVTDPSNPISDPDQIRNLTRRGAAGPQTPAPNTTGVPFLDEYFRYLNQSNGA